jgi:hypothetical protein
MPKSNGFNGKTINHGMHAGLSIFFKSTSTSNYTMPGLSKKGWYQVLLPA